MPWGDFKQLFEYFSNVAIILRHPDFIVFAKPPGVETVSRTGGPDLLGIAREELGEEGLLPAHRLDRDTSGAQIFARNPEAERDLAELFRRREVEKAYLGVCLGAPRNRAGTINRGLSEWRGGHRPVRIVKNGGLEASTAYRLLAAAPGREPRASLIAFFPRQGRTHQIRVHAAGIGYPILGDDQYGDRNANRAAKERWGLRRQALHSWRLAFRWRGETVEAVCPLADDLRAAAEAAAGAAKDSLPYGIFAAEA